MPIAVAAREVYSGTLLRPQHSNPDKEPTMILDLDVFTDFV
jgi:hypothetical protein